LWKSYENNSPSFCFKPPILTIGPGAKFFYVIQVSILKSILKMAEKIPFGEGASITDHHLFVEWIINYGKLEWKSLLNKLIKEFGMLF